MKGSIISFRDLLSTFCFFGVMAIAASQVQAGPFADNGDGTLTDQASGIIWQQEDDGVARNWADAFAYCDGLEYAGLANWWLPTVEEWTGLSNYFWGGGATFSLLGLDTVCYWTATAYSKGSHKYVFSFWDESTNGCDLNEDDASLLFTRCVTSLGNSGNVSSDSIPAPHITVTTNGTRIAISWDPVPGATGYYLFADQSQPGAEFDGNFEYEWDWGNKTEFTAELWENACLYVALKAYNSASSSDFSNFEYIFIQSSQFPTLPDALAAIVELATGNSLSEDYDNGKKWLFVMGASFGIGSGQGSEKSVGSNSHIKLQKGLTLGFDIYIDLADWRGITSEGQAGWVTVLADLKGSIGLSYGLPVSAKITAIPIEFSNTSQADADKPFSISVSGPSLNILVVSITSGEIGSEGLDPRSLQWGNFGLGVSVIDLSGSCTVVKCEIQKSILSAAFATTQMMSLGPIESSLAVDAFTNMLVKAIGQNIITNGGVLWRWHTVSD